MRVRGGKMPTDIRTDAILLARLQKAAGITMTAEQLRRQRLSFIHGSMPHDSKMSLEQIRDVLERHEGTKQVA
jgi:hypothetical protein